jgi:6-pyruvoyltetrahydropterin/6-carboxytetrahydropterin synthase
LYETGVVGEFSAALSLNGDFGPAIRIHGHTYRVELTVRAPELKPDGTLFDISLLKAILTGALEPLNYQYLNDLPDFEGINPTVEVVAKHIYDIIRPELRDYTISVRIWESTGAFAGYDGTD